MCSDKKTGSAIGTVLIENDRTKVWRWRFPNRGDNTGWHRHEHDYVVVPLFNGILQIDNGDGVLTTAELKQGVPYFRELGVEHDVINGNDFACEFIEVEFLDKG